MAKLTKKVIDGLKPGASDRVVWDDELPRFGLRVKPSGQKSFIIQYRNESGRSRRVTVGRYGVLTPDQARKEARQKLGEVSKGGDPAQEKHDKRHGVTVAELAERYLELHARPKKKPSSIMRDQDLIDRFINPKLGKLRVEAVTYADVSSFHHEIRKTPVKANRTLAVLSKMFSLAIKWGLKPDGIHRRQERPPLYIAVKPGRWNGSSSGR